MSNKKEEKDVLADVLTGTHEEQVPGLAELTELIQRQGQPAETPKAPTGQVRQKQRRHRTSKKKTTHYLSQEVFEELGEAREKLQHMLPEEAINQISKSGIVDTALRMILRELEQHGKESVLYRQLIKEINRKQ